MSELTCTHPIRLTACEACHRKTCAELGHPKADVCRCFASPAATQVSSWATWLVRHGVPNRSDALDVAESLVPMLAEVWDQGNLSGARWGTSQTYPIDADVPSSNPFRSEEIA